MTFETSNDLLWAWFMIIMMKFHIWSRNFLCFKFLAHLTQSVNRAFCHHLASIWQKLFFKSSLKSLGQFQPKLTLTFLSNVQIGPILIKIGLKILASVIIMLCIWWSHQPTMSAFTVNRTFGEKHFEQKFFLFITYINQMGITGSWKSPVLFNHGTVSVVSCWNVYTQYYKIK